MDTLKGYKTYITMGLMWICALYQYFVEPIPSVDPEQFAIVSTTLALALRYITTGPAPSLKEMVGLGWKAIHLKKEKDDAPTT